MPKVGVGPLSPLDAQELRSEIGLSETELLDTRDYQTHGASSDLVVLVACSLPAINALALWLTKRRKVSTIELELTRQASDGTIIRKAFRVRRSESQADAAQSALTAELTKAIDELLLETREAQ
jgi:hypothetical protein